MAHRKAIEQMVIFVHAIILLFCIVSISCCHFCCTKTLFFFLQTVRELKNKIEMHIKTCIRYGYATQKLCEAYNSRVGQSSGKSGFGVYIDTGRQSTIAGAGKMYADYQKTGLLQGFTGCGITPTPFKNANSDEAPIRLMTFVDTYYGLRYKITRSNCLN